MGDEVCVVRKVGVHGRLKVIFPWLSMVAGLLLVGQPALAQGSMKEPGIDPVAAIVRFDAWVELQPRLWPGFSPSTLPLAITDSGKSTVVAHLERRPGGFFPVASARSRIWSRRGAVAGISDSRRLDATLEGRRIAVVPLTYLAQEGAPAERRLLLPLFMAFVRDHFPHFAEFRTSRETGKLAAYGLDNRALLALETRILQTTWASPEGATRRAGLASWSAVRRARLQLLPPAEARREVLAETFDGLVQYVEARALVSEAQREAELGARMLPLLRADTATSGGLSVRRGASGALLALMLDREGFASWKALVSSGLTLSECVERQTGISGTDWETLFAEARRVHRFNSLRDQLQAEERNAPPGYHAFLLEGDGKVVLAGLPRAVDRGDGQIDWSRAGGEWFRLLGPTPPTEIDARTLLAQRLEGLHYRRGGVDVQLGAGPVLMTSQDLSWPCHRLTYHDDLSRARLTVDGRPVSWNAPGTGFTRDFSIQSGRGRVRVAGRGQIELLGRTLTITLQP
jgi:hypothetical protein